jgi:hypothetical protein
MSGSLFSLLQMGPLGAFYLRQNQDQEFEDLTVSTIEINREPRIYANCVRNAFGLKKYAKQPGYLLKQSELHRVCEYSRFGIWEKTSRTNETTIVIDMSRRQRRVFMSGNYNWRLIIRNKGELCAAVRAERFNPRNSAKWEGWGF